MAPPKAVYVEDTSLPRAVIFDIDGTLAKMNGRKPFDWSRVSEDLVKEPISQLAKMYYESGIHVIIFSGRDGCCEQDTRQWLKTNGINYSLLVMRDAGNNEKDSIVKKRMFEENIRGKYNVQLVVDDRDQVVKMWREELGLTCLQVDYGDF